MSKSELHTWASYYASRGWEVFPLKPNTPLPLTAHGLADSSKDPAQIDAWWSKWPDANIAINLAASGMMVFDVDPQNGGDVTAAREYPGITSSMLADTPSGGTHSFFQVPAGIEVPGRFGLGIDGKWRGYVLLYPSVRKGFKDKPDGAYKWRGEGFHNHAPIIPQVLRRAPRVQREKVEARAGSLEDLPVIRECLDALDESYYEEGNWIQVAMALHHWESNTEGAGTAGFELFDDWSSQDPQGDRYQPSSLDALWDRLKDDGDNAITLGSLKHWAGKTAEQQQKVSIAAASAAFASVPVEQRQQLWTTQPVEGFHIPFDAARILAEKPPKLEKAWQEKDLPAICWGLAYETGGCSEHMLEVIRSIPDYEQLWPGYLDEILKATHGRKDHKGVSAYTRERAAIIVPAHSAWPSDSEQHHGLLLAEEQSAFIKFSPGLGWFAWEEHKGKWEADDGVHARRLLHKQLLASFKEDTAATKKTSLGTASKMKGMLTCAQDHPALMVESDRWDADSFILNTPNAAYDLRTGLEVERSHLFVSKATEVSPDFDMPTPIWEAALRKACPDWQFLEQALSYGLTAERTEELMFVAYGDGSNGKSKLLEAVKGMLGDYAVMLNGSVLLRGNQHEDVKEMAMLRGKRFVFVDELKQGMTWDDARVKKLVTDSTISVKLMHKNGFEAPALHKIFVATNHLPNIDANDYGMERRLALVKFPLKMRRDEVDKDFAIKLKAEWPGILARLIKLCGTWWADRLTLPQSVTDNVRQYLALNDDVDEWVQECCDVSDPTAITRTTDLYQSLAAWIEPSKKSLYPRKTLKSVLIRKGFLEGRNSQVRGLMGIKIASSMPQ